MNDGNGVGTSGNSGTPPIGTYDNNPPVAGGNYPNSGTSSENSSSYGRSDASNGENINNQNISDNGVSSSSLNNVSSSTNNPNGEWIILANEEYLKIYQELLDSIEKQIGTDGEISSLLREIRFKYVNYAMMDGMDEKQYNEQIEQQIHANIDKVDQYVREHSDYDSYAELMQSKAEFEADKAACEQMIKYYTNKPIWEEYYNKLEIAKKEMPPQTGIAGKRGLKGDPINKIQRLDSYEDQLIELFGENYKEVFAQYGLDLDFDYVQLYNYIYENEGEAAAEEFYKFAEENIKSLAGLVDALEETSLLSKDKWYSTVVNFVTAHLEGIGYGTVSSFEGVMHWFEENPSKTETDYQFMWYMLMLQTNEFGAEDALTLSYQVGQGTGQMLPAIAISMLIGMICPEGLALPMGVALEGSTVAEIGASAFLFASTGGRDYAEQMQNGMSRDQAILHGIATGGLEVTTEKLLGGLSVFGHESPTNLKQLFISMAKEGGQEVTQDLLSEILLGDGIPSFETKEDAIEYFKQKGMTFVVAALSAGEIEGGSTAVSIHNIKDIYNNYLNNPNIDVTEADLANLIRRNFPQETVNMSDAEVIGKYNEVCLQILNNMNTKVDINKSNSDVPTLNNEQVNISEQRIQLSEENIEKISNCLDVIKNDNQNQDALNELKSIYNMPNVSDLEILSIACNQMRLNILSKEGFTTDIDGCQVKVIGDSYKLNIAQKRLQDIIQSLPESLKVGLKQVNICEESSPMEAYHAVNYDMCNFFSEADYSNGVITIWNGGEVLLDRESFIHELAHAIDDIISEENFSNSDEWIKAIELDSKNSENKYVSEYSNLSQSSSEDFADSIVQYFDNPEMFKIKYPNRFYLIEQVLENIQLAKNSDNITNDENPKPNFLSFSKRNLSRLDQIVKFMNQKHSDVSNFGEKGLAAYYFTGDVTYISSEYRELITQIDKNDIYEYFKTTNKMYIFQNIQSSFNLQQSKFSSIDQIVRFMNQKHSDVSNFGEKGLAAYYFTGNPNCISSEYRSNITQISYKDIYEYFRLNNKMSFLFNARQQLQISAFIKECQNNSNYRLYSQYVHFNQQQFDVTSVRPYLEQRYKNCNNVHIEYWGGYDGRCFMNFYIGSELIQGNDAIKIYVPVESNSYNKAVVSIMDYLCENNISSDNKIADSSRGDGIVLRINNYEDAIKVINFLNSNPNIPANSQNIPFAMQFGKISLAMDGMLSYNSTSIRLFEHYMSEHPYDASYTGFRNYVKQLLYNVYHRNDLTEIESIFYDDELRMLDRFDYDRNSYYTNVLQVMRLLNISLDFDSDINVFLNECRRNQSLDDQLVQKNQVMRMRKGGSSK